MNSTPYRDRYTSAAFYRRELDAVFRRTWVVAAPIGAVPRRGDFVRVDLGHSVVVLIRDADPGSDTGGVRAFRDTCPHRGHRLTGADAGRTDEFVCPYHRWRFALDGQCVAIPGASGLSCSPSDVQLDALRVAIRHGLIWVSEAGDDRPGLVETLGPADDWLSPYRLDSWSAKVHVRVSLSANWKASVDVHNEAYHLRSLHPEVLGMVDASSPRIEMAPRALRIRTPMFRETPGEALDARGAALFEGLGVATDLPTAEREAAAVAALREGDRAGKWADLSDEALLENQLVYVFPNAQFNLHRDHAMIFLHRPGRDALSCRFEQIVLARDPAERAPSVTEVTREGRSDRSGDGSRPRRRGGGSRPGSRRAAPSRHVFMTTSNPSLRCTGCSTRPSRSGAHELGASSARGPGAQGGSRRLHRAVRGDRDAASASS